MTRRHPYLDHDGPIAFAHRGGASSAPENTMLAFEDAVSLGYRYVETDVRVTADGVLVAFHDDDLERTCRVRKRIGSTTWDELRSLRVDGREPIPLLEDILGAWPDLKVNVDCKTDAAVGALVECLGRTNSLDRVCLGSFSDARLVRLRALLGEGVCTSMGPRSVARLVGGAVAPWRVRVPQEPIAQVPLRQGPIPVVTASFIEHAHRHDIAVHVWTVDDPAQMGRLLDAGVDGIMTDDTRALRDVFVARDIWPR